MSMPDYNILVNHEEASTDSENAYKRVAKRLHTNLNYKRCNLYDVISIIENDLEISSKLQYLLHALEEFTEDRKEDIEINVHELSDFISQVREAEDIHGVSNRFLNLLWQKRAKSFIQQVQLANNKLKEAFLFPGTDEALEMPDDKRLAKWQDDVAEAVKEITEIWKKVNLEFFFRSLSALDGVDLLHFTECMLFEVPNNDEKGKTACGICDLNNLLPARQLMSAANDVVLARSQTKFLQKSFGTIWNTKSAGILGLDELFFDKITPSLAFTTNCLPFQLDEYPEILVAIKDPRILFAVKGSHGHSLFIKAIFTQAWQGDFGFRFSVQFEFYLGMLCQIVFLILVMYVAGSARAHSLPPKGLVMALVLISLGDLSGQIFELISAVCWRTKYGDQKIRGNGFCSLHHIKLWFDHICVGDLWTVFEFIMSVYGVTLSMGLMLCQMERILNLPLWHTVKDDISYQHPIWLTFFVLFKLHQIILRTLAIRAFGKQVIPAYVALFHKSSTRFVLFMVLIWFNAFVTYYAIPVKLNPDFWPNMWLMMVEMYRLLFSGEASLDYLEGLHQKMNLTEANGHFIGEIYDNLKYKQWHYGLYVLYMAFYLFMNIGLINVLIGIVGNNYNRCYEIRKELFENYRAAYSYKILVRRSSLKCLRRKQAKDIQDNNMWLLFKPEVFKTRKSG